jgi:hypothetical protein
MSQFDIALGGGVCERTAAVRAGGRCVRTMTLLLVGTAAAAATIGAQTADAALVAAWNFNGFDPETSSVVTASAGSGTLDFSAIGAGVGVMQGTTLGAQPGDLAGNALAAIGNASNQTFFRIDLAAAGFRDLSLGFATRRSSTGFATNRVEFWNGLGWSTVTTFGANATAWEWQSHSLASIGNIGDEPLALRIVIDGATGSTGSIRFDNIAVMGTAVPAPAGSLALLALAGCVSRRRR